MPCGVKGGGDAADKINGLSIGDGFAVSGDLITIAHAHDRESFRRRPYCAMAAARVIGMPMGDEGARHGNRGVDPDIGGGDIDAFAPGFDPTAEP